VKAETLQRTGSFKFRGAYNALFGLDVKQRGAEVVSYSSGNHAQGLAAAAQLLGVSATVVMPTDAPGIKIENTRGFGAEVIFYDRYREDRVAIAERIAAERGAAIIPSFDDPQVIAGQGTVGLEVTQDAMAQGARVDAVVIPCSGGGLAAGCALAIAAAFPDAEIYTAEPIGIDDMRRSLAAGKRLSSDPAARSICDSLTTRTPGELTFAITRQFLAGGFAVSDGEVMQAMAAGFTDYKLVIEPGGAAALAAVLGQKLDVKGKTVVAIASGGNVDREVFGRTLNCAKPLMTAFVPAIET
jgi:threonine dehydratase